MELFKRENILKRIRPFYQDSSLIKVITGIRRCGKSSIMKLISQELEENNGVPSSSILFLDLNSRPYKRISKPDELEALIETQTKGIEGTKYLFIDEVQNVKGFETVLESFRLEGDFNFFITGSNSYLLSGELITKLTGRYLEFEMGTLTFDEYLAMKSFYGQTLSSLAEEFQSFLQDGGFPQTIFLSDSYARKEYCKNIIHEIFLKDIKRNHRIRNGMLFEQVQNYILHNFGSATSITSLAAYLSKTNGVKVSVQSVYNYIDLLLNAKIIERCSRFDLKSKVSLKGEEKYYLADMSFYFATQTDNRIPYGACLENIVYNYAKNKGYHISIGKIGKFECDFIFRNSITGDYSYAQVCYTMTGQEETEEREYRPLESISDNYPKYILTTDTFLQRRNGILHVNVYDFMSKGLMF